MARPSVTRLRIRTAIIWQTHGSRRVRVFAPATVANIGPGFDVLGLALSSPGDFLEAELSHDRPGRDRRRHRRRRASEPRPGEERRQPRRSRCAAARRQRARAALVAAQTDAAGERSRKLRRQQRGRRVGGQRAARPAVVAGDVVLCAMEGERAASGTPHADNVAPSVMGGIVLVRSYDRSRLCASGARRPAHQRRASALPGLDRRGAEPRQ